MEMRRIEWEGFILEEVVILESCATCIGYVENLFLCKSVIPRGCANRGTIWKAVGKIDENDDDNAK